MNAEISGIALDEIMVCKNCNGSFLILENRNINREYLCTKLVLRWNNSRCTSNIQTSMAQIRTNEESNTRLITLSTPGIRVLRKGRNAALKLFAILNLSKPVIHVTEARNTEN